jgi:NAD(P)-dependent dehydrogenase (short-subunit alcohol dehydrogenase family)
MAGRLRGKVAVVTGAAGGIGSAIARTFAAEGAKLVLADLDEGACKRLAESLTLEHDIRAARCDVSRSEDVKAVIDFAVAAFGRLDVLCNNAGVEGPQASTANYEEDAFDRVLAINLRGVFLGMKHGIPAMLKSGGGVVVNTASVAGMVGLPGVSGYGASKAGVLSLTRNAALEYAKRNIRVNAIAPGVIDTAMTQRLGARRTGLLEQLAAMAPMGRLGKPEDIASAAVFLASDEAAFITGAVLVVDGGLTAQ